MNARLHALLERPAVAWSRTWLLPVALACVSALVYLFVILPFDARPWYVRPPPKPGKSVIFRTLNHVHRVHDDVDAKLARRAPTPARPAAAAAANPPAGKPGAPAGKPGAPATADPASADPEEDPGSPERSRRGGVEVFTEPRPRAELDELWATIGAAPFADEPLAGPWASVHRSLIFQIIAQVREKTFKGSPDAPQVALGDVECRTIRCTIVLTSPYTHELELLVAAVERLRLRNEPLWRVSERGPLTPFVDEEREEESNALQVTMTLGFAADLPEVQALTLDGARLSPTISPLGAQASERRPH
ncbi:MAG: hypothetical protein H6711_31820 [Myxococcales bacterium]|nr:hypothetical protein [Myxococcales bacterium]